MSEPWDYLIVTAANERQAAAYELQIRWRRERGQLARVRHVLVVPDAGGRRAGSGGSTLECLREVLRREAGGENPEAVFGRLRILIVHAGGDSRRLPAYSPCGKIFVPLPGDAPTLFDRLVPAFLDLPGRIVVAAGDALILFDPAEVQFAREGITTLAAPATPAEAARHGVLCASADGSVRLYLQKPSAEEQERAGAIGRDGQSALDIGIMNINARAAAGLLRAFETLGVQCIDLYREICCALGTDATLAHYLAAARASGSEMEEPVLAALFEKLRAIPFHAEMLSACRFLHFGSTRQLISSGQELWPHGSLLSINNEVQPGGRGAINGTDSWVEGCRISAPLTLHGNNVIVGVDVMEPFELPRDGCLDIIPGFDRNGDPVSFIRYYKVDDTFKDSDLWDARIFPAEKDPTAYRAWFWMLEKRAHQAANLYSAAEIALLADHEAFHARRAAIRDRIRDRIMERTT